MVSGPTPHTATASYSCCLYPTPQVQGLASPSMAMREQERRSPPMETARTASNEPQLPGLGLTTGRPAAAMATGDMVGGGAGEGERCPGSVLPSSPWGPLLSVVGSHTASPEFQRKPRSYVLRGRAAPSHPWGSKFPALPPAPTRKVRRKRQRVHRAPLPAAVERPAKKRARVCAQCGTTQTPLWRTSPTDRHVMLCNACGIRARQAAGAARPEQVHVHVHLPTATTVVVSEQEQPPPQEILQGSEYVHLPTAATATTVVVSEQEPPPSHEIQQGSEESPPDSPILDSMLDFDVYLLKRTSPRRDKSPPPPPPTAGLSAAALAPFPSGKKDKQEKKWCLHCGTTSSLQWRTGPMGVSTLCNACGVRYRQGRLVPEYRPRASPTFDQSEHSYKHREVLQLREVQDRPAPPAAFQPSGNRRKRRKGKGPQQHQPAQARKKRKGSEEQDQQPAQPAAVAVLQVRKESDKVRLKLRKELKGKEQHRRPATQQRAGSHDMVQHLRPPPPPPPPTLLPHAGYVMVQQHLLPPPPAAQPHAGYDMVQYLPLPPALPHAGDDDDMEMEQHVLLLAPALPRAGDEMVVQYLPPPPPPELPHAADDDMEMERRRLLPLPPALPHAGDELTMMGEPMPIPPLDPFLFDGPAAPRIIDDDDEPATVIVIDDDDEPVTVIVIDDD